MHLIVGLGNPGREYVATRHNVGFELLDVLAHRLGFTGSKNDFDRVARSKFDALALDGSITLPSGEPEKVLLLKPLTFMNLSGRAVQAAMAFYNLGPADVLIVLDDLALPCGKLRIRPGGSSGGHNGLKDIERALGTTQYPRLRIGIDPAPPRIPGRDYVLGRFTDAQRELLEPALDRGSSAVVTWIESGVDAAMSRFNADPVEEKRGGDKETG